MHTWCSSIFSSNIFDILSVCGDDATSAKVEKAREGKFKEEKKVKVKLGRSHTQMTEYFLTKRKLWGVDRSTWEATCQKNLVLDFYVQAEIVRSCNDMIEKAAGSFAGLKEATVVNIVIDAFTAADGGASTDLDLTIAIY